MSKIVFLVSVLRYCTAILVLYLARMSFILLEVSIRRMMFLMLLRCNADLNEKGRTCVRSDFVCIFLVEQCVERNQVLSWCLFCSFQVTLSFE